jgi:hypothetical protein
MSDASSDVIAHQRESGWVGRKADGELSGAWDATLGDGSERIRQQPAQPAVAGRQIPYGVKSVSKADKGKLTEPRNFIVDPCPTRLG